MAWQPHMLMHWQGLFLMSPPVSTPHQMNMADSERMAGCLEAAGYECAEDPSDADVLVYNTCSIREKAEMKVYSALGKQVRFTCFGPSVVVMLGCYRRMMSAAGARPLVRCWWRLVTAMAARARHQSCCQLHHGLMPLPSHRQSASVHRWAASRWLWRAVWHSKRASKCCAVCLRSTSSWVSVVLV